VITKVLISTAMVLGSYVVGAAPVGADPNPTETHANPFDSLTCGCHETPPAKTPGLKTEVDRGIWSALAVTNGPPERG
jgi:hypothetical protein